MWDITHACSLLSNIIIMLKRIFVYSCNYFYLFFMVSTVSHIILLSHNPIYPQICFIKPLFFIIINLVDEFINKNSVVVHACLLTGIIKVEGDERTFQSSNNITLQSLGCWEVTSIKLSILLSTQVLKLIT